MKTQSQDLIALLDAFGSAPDTDAERAAGAVLELANRLVGSGRFDAVAPDVWHRFLDVTRRSAFLTALGSREKRFEWADLTFPVIAASNYTLQTMFEQRVAEHPDRILFSEPGGVSAGRWSYGRSYARMKAIAAACCKVAEDPRVLLCMENSPDGACADLACLTFGLFVSPVNASFDVDTLSWIVQKLGINVVVVDSEQRMHRFSEVRKRTAGSFRVLVTDPANKMLGKEDLYLGEACSRLSAQEIDATLSARPARGLHDVATMMYTSGSTGEPKGVAFTLFNLITKRFARAAALPSVGENERLLCYLPLFHTFGRYLEMMGMVFWGGTYAFVGNPSAETFFRRLKEVQPTGLIGIPLRWQQIMDRTVASVGESAEIDVERDALRAIVGQRLRWGLSAAGYLAPRTFRFFHRNDVALCSGFGMTEATGGITMTPPGEYRDDSVGLPLPGIAARLGSRGELEISGPYLGRYADQLNDSDAASASFDALNEVVWLRTGDLFKVGEDGQYEIVDRIKDIYKNNRGQTVAPRRVEQKFKDVPGIHRTFLVGDRRDYNVLLIVPDRDVPVLSDSPDERDQYFRNIVTAANQELMPHERVINIATIDRDFDVEHGELTPKGSYRRKQIAANFSGTIDELYASDGVEFSYRGFTVRAPRWFFRDLGILETDIVHVEEGLFDRSRKRALTIRRRAEAGTVQIGDLEYLVGDVIDLGLFARHPALWAGNASLVGFCPCKEGWDAELGRIGEHIFLPYRDTAELDVESPGDVGSVRSQLLLQAHTDFVAALYGGEQEAIEALDRLEEILGESDDKISALVLSRLEALARHPVERVRCHAYSIMLLNRPTQDYRSVFPAFLQSGLSFLNDEYMHKLAHHKIERRRLEALRLRMLNYRTNLNWPATPVVREQVERLLGMMANFVKTNPEFYYGVRAELSSWIVNETHPQVMKAAEKTLLDLADWFESALQTNTQVYTESDWLDRMVFEEGITDREVTRLKEAFVCTAFLHQSIMLAFDVSSFDLSRVSLRGIWFSRMLSHWGHNRYRVSVNTVDGRHYELMVTVREDYGERSVMQVVYWLLALSDHPVGPGTLPRLGCCRPEMGVMSVVFVGDLTVWERIREYSATRASAFGGRRPGFLRRLFTRAMAAYFAGCHRSDYRIVPGHVSPTNVVVPEPDYRPGATILSLGGWKPYENSLSLVRSLLKNFYEQTGVHYPWSAEALDTRWIFDACIEALGEQDGRAFLHQMGEDLAREQRAGAERDLANALRTYLADLETDYYVPLPVKSATERYREWTTVHPDATSEARESMVDKLYRLYDLDRFGEPARFHLYRHTYFADAPDRVREPFDYLLSVLFKNPGISAISVPELSELQSTLEDSDDRHVFGRLVFPHAREVEDLEVLAVGEKEMKHIVVRSQISSSNGVTYFVREATEPSEIGQLYRFFLTQRYPKTVSRHDRFLVVVDGHDRLVGGVCYEVVNRDVVHLDGIVMARPLQGKGLGSELLEDFCMRMANLGFSVVKTYYYSRNFYLKRGFRTDRRWGGLVRFLDAK